MDTLETMASGFHHNKDVFGNYIPGATEPVKDFKIAIDLKDIKPSIPPMAAGEHAKTSTDFPEMTLFHLTHLSESLYFRRLSLHRPITTDTTAVRQQLERIATLLDDGFRAREDRRVSGSSIRLFMQKFDLKSLYHPNAALPGKLRDRHSVTLMQDHFNP